MEDPDSANERVLKALGKSNIYITEDFAIGVLLQVDQDGAIQVSAPGLPEAPPRLAVTGIDRGTQTAILTNSGLDLDISGFLILSQRGNELFVLPKVSWLPGGRLSPYPARPGLSTSCLMNPGHGIRKKRTALC